MSAEAEKVKTRGPNGGARPGAGRKRKRDKNGTAIEQAERRIRDRLPEVIDAMFDLALGVTVEEVDDAGGVRVYRRPPNQKAAAYLIDRIMGKPTERQEQEHAGGLAIRIEYADTDPEAEATP